MEAGKFSFKFSRQTQKNLVGSSKYAYFSTVGFFFAANFIQNLYTVLKKRLWESRSTPILASRLFWAASEDYKANVANDAVVA
jgi:hypothetical protein